MKIKMAASMLLCSFVLLCSEVSAAGLSGQLLQSADCGCEAAPAVENCGCEAAADEGCGCRQPVRGLLSKLRSGGGCGGGCEAAAVPAPAVDCGCEAAPSCGCKSGGLKGLLKRMAGQVPGDCGCGPTCDDPAPVVEESCGCAPEPAPVDCGCEAAAAPAPACGCQKGGLLGRLASRSCGCGSKPLAGRFGGAFEPVSAPVADCGCAPEAAPVADCGCEAAPAPAPSCGCQKGGLLGRLKSRSCGCGSAAPAPVADCGCASEPTPAPVADCGCEAAPAPSCGRQSGGLLGRLSAGGCGCGSGAAASDCGCEAAPAPSCGRQSGGLLGRLSAGGCGCGSGAAASDCGCQAAPAPAPASSCGCGAPVGSSCGCSGSASGGYQFGQRLKSGCNRCGRSSCNGGCRRNSGGLTLLNKLRGDRIVRDTSNCGRCMPACPDKGCDSGCGCSSCGSAAGGVVYDYAPSMEVAPAVQPMAPAVPAATEGSIVPVMVEPMGAMKKIQPVVDSAAFVLRNQK